MTQETAKAVIDRLQGEAGYATGGYVDRLVFSGLDVHEMLNEIEQAIDTDKLSVEKLQEELESCIQTLISVSVLANGDENIVIGNFVDSRLSKLAKTHENVTKYIEKVTGKNIDVVLAENVALEAEEENE